eukprot:g2435.t1
MAEAEVESLSFSEEEKKALRTSVPLVNEKLYKKLEKLMKLSLKNHCCTRGVKEVTKTLRKKHKGIVLIAGDCAPVDVIAHIPVYCEDRGVPYAFIPTRRLLGSAINSMRGASCIMLLASPIKKKPESETSHQKIIVEESLDASIRLSAAISLKRIVERIWDPVDEEERPLPEQDKAQIKGNILEALIRSPETIRNQLLEILKTIVSTDFPERWPELKVAVIQGLHTQDEGVVLGSLFAIRFIARRFEFRTSSDEHIFEEMLQVGIPKILQILHSCATNSDPGEIYGEIIKAICKFFWSVTFTKMPLVLQEQTNFNLFMESLLILVQRELPLQNLPPVKSEQNSWIWWKVKKWVLHLTTRFFKYYGSTDKVKDNEKPFAEMYIAQCSLTLLEAHMQLLVKLSSMPNQHERVMAQLVNYMDQAISIPQTYQVMKEHVKPILLNIVFPLLCFTEADAELLTENPEEFVRKSHDFLEDIFGVKAAAANFVLNVCRSRSKGVSDEFLTHLNNVMNEYNKNLSEGQQSTELARKMDGALMALGTLEPVLMKKKMYKRNIESVLLQYVMPCFQSGHSHLRSRACWIAGKFSAMKFKEGRGTGSTFQTLLQSVVLSMNDPELPVRVDAVIALKFFVDTMDSMVHFKFILPDLLNIFFGLMNEIENEDIVDTLETIVEKLGEDIAPFAEDLGRNLAAAFNKCMGDEDDDDFESLCAFGCIRAMTTLIQSVHSSANLCNSLEELFYPVIDSIIMRENQELIEDVVDMMAFFTYYSPQISPRMWSLFPKLHSAYMTWAFEYFDYIAGVLENFLIKGKETFVTCKSPDYFSMFNQMVEHALAGDYQEVEFHPALKLIEVALQNLKGTIDGFLAPYLHLTIQKMKTAERSDTKVLVFNVLANSMWYNASLTLHILTQEGVLQEAMTTWLEMIYLKKEDGKMKYFLKMSDKKIGVLGLGSLLTVPDEQFPGQLRPTQVLGGVMTLLDGAKRQEEAVKENTSGDEYDPEGDSDLEEEDDDDDDEESGVESLSNTSSSYNKLLEKETRKLLLGYQGSDSDDYCETDLSSDDEDAPIYGLDPYAAFSDMLDYMETANTSRLQSALAEMDDQSKGALMAMMEYGKQKKMEAANGALNQVNGRSM